MGLMALMATALPPTQMSVLPSIVDSSSKTATALTEAGQPTNQGSFSNGGTTAQESTNNNNGISVVKFPTYGSRQSLTTNTVLERSQSSGSQILVPSALKASLPKLSLIGDGQGGTETNGSGAIMPIGPAFQQSTSSAQLLSVVSTNGKLLQQESVAKNSKISTTASLMLTFEGESSNPSSTTPGFSYVGPITTTTTSKTSSNSDGYDPEEDIMYRV